MKKFLKYLFLVVLLSFFVFIITITSILFLTFIFNWEMDFSFLDETGYSLIRAYLIAVYLVSMISWIHYDKF